MYLVFVIMRMLNYTYFQVNICIVYCFLIFVILERSRESKTIHSVTPSQYSLSLDQWPYSASGTSMRLRRLLASWNPVRVLISGPWDTLLEIASIFGLWESQEIASRSEWIYTISISIKTNGLPCSKYREFLVLMQLRSPTGQYLTSQQQISKCFMFPDF